MKNINTKSGMTMAEMLIVLGIIGVIAMICMPSIRTIVPTRYEAMMKKGASELEHAVSDLVSSDELYERTDTPDNTNFTMTHRHGLQSTYRVIFDGEIYGSDLLNTPAQKRAARQKFCLLLATRLELDDSVEVNCTPPASLTSECALTPVCEDFSNNCNEVTGVGNSNTCPSFVTKDGIQWVIPISDFSNGPEVILYRASSAADHNAPNCARVSTDIKNRYSALSSNDHVKTSEEECKRPDIGVYVVFPDGTLHKETATSDEVIED